MATFEHTTPQWISRGQVKGNWQSAMNLKPVWVTLKGNFTLCSSSYDSQPGWEHVRGLEQLHLGKGAFPNYTESSRKHCDVNVQTCNDYFEFPLWIRYDIPKHPGSWIYIPDLMTPKFISLHLTAPMNSRSIHPAASSPLPLGRLITRFSPLKLITFKS